MPSRTCTRPSENHTLPQPLLHQVVPGTGSNNLYIRGLPFNTTVQDLLRLCEPFGQIVSCKPMLYMGTRYCRGDGFVRFASEDGFRTARRELTQRGFYVAVAHESATMKHFYTMGQPLKMLQQPQQHTRVVPEITDTQEFPSLPCKSTKSKENATPSTSNGKQRHKHELKENKDEDQVKVKNSTELCADSALTNGPSSLHDSPIAQANASKPHEAVACVSITAAEQDSRLNAEVEWTTLHGNGYKVHCDIARVEDAKVDGMAMALGFAISEVSKPPTEWHDQQQQQQQQATGNFQYSNAISHTASLFHDRPYSSIDDIDNYMYQPTELFFQDLPSGTSYLDLFECCSQYGPLILTSVDLRYIKEDCHGKGKVKFTTYADSESALICLRNAGYNVTREMSEATIDVDLYEQLHQQHPDALDVPFAFFRHEETLGLDPWGFDMKKPLSTGLDGQAQTETGQQFGALPHKHEKHFMFDMSPKQASLSPASSSTVSLPISNDWSDHALESEQVKGSTMDLPHNSTSMVPVGGSDSETFIQVNERRPTSARKVISYSDMVKVAPKQTVPKPSENEQSTKKADDYDMKRRGNTNKSLDKSEYRLNLFLKNLEPTMNDCQLFGKVMSCRTISNHHGQCTGLGFVMYMRNESVTRALKGLHELGYQAEIAIPSATNKLRCKEMSDTLFLQNIPECIAENKLRELFKPFTVMSCHILKDARTGKGRGVAFL
ncbi:RNA-binding motif, single-stranded-interacting protein 1, partial [Podila epigama]